MALLDPHHPGPYITLYGLIRPYEALLGSVAVAVAVAFAVAAAVRASERYPYLSPRIKW